MDKEKIYNFKPYDDILKINQDMTISDMVQLLADNPQIHHLCIVDEDNKLMGLIDQKRLFKAIFSHHVSESSRIHELFTLLTSEKAADLMIRHVITVSPDASVDSVIEMMIRESIYEMPVVDEQKGVLGFFSLKLILTEWLKTNKAYR